MAIEGTGIKTPSKQASKKATAFLGGFQKRADEKFIKTYERKKEGGIQNSDFETDRYNKLKQKYGDQFSSDARSNYFSPGGGAFDERNDIKVAQVGSNFSNLTTDTGTETAQPLSPIGSEAYNKELEGFKEEFRKDFNYRTRYDLDTGEEIDKYFRKVPGGDVYGEKEMERDYPTFRKFRYERNPLQYEQGVPFGKKEEKKPSLLERTANLAGSIFNTVTGTQPVAASQVGGEIPKGTQFTSKNLDAAKTVGDTSFASYRMGGGEQKQQSGTVVTPVVKPQYEINRTQNRPSVGGRTETGDTSFSSYVRAGGEGQQRGIVSPTSTGAPRQTVASLPSNYKQTEAESFRKAAAFKEAQAIAKRNPNVSVGVDSKGKPRATATNNSGVARAQAMAVNRKLSGTKPKSAKQRAQDAAKARKAAGPNRRMSDGQQTRSQAGASARTAQGNRARVKANARKRAQAAARRRRAKKKACDIFLKYNISPLTNMNLIRDDLAEVAYFVKEIQK